MTKEYLVILGIIGYSNTYTYKRLSKIKEVDNLALDILISKDILYRYEKHGDIVKLSIKGELLFESLQNILNLSLFNNIKT